MQARSAALACLEAILDCVEGCAPLTLLLPQESVTTVQGAVQRVMESDKSGGGVGVVAARIKGRLESVFGGVAGPMDE